MVTFEDGTVPLTLEDSPQLLVILGKPEESSWTASLSLIKADPEWAKTTVNGVYAGAA